MCLQTLVSIIFIVRNSGVDLFMSMESLKVSRITIPYEVIIVNEDSVDGCCDFLMDYRFPRPVRVLKRDSRLPSRNLAAVHAAGQYLIFCSPRLYFEDGWMESLLKPLTSKRSDCVSPALKLHENSRKMPQTEYEGSLLQSIQNYPWTTDDGQNLSWLSWECFAVNRDNFNLLGGVEEGFRSREIETAEFSMRVWLFGGICHYVPDVSLRLVFRNNFPSDDSSSQWDRDLLRWSYLHFDDHNISLCKDLIHRVKKTDELPDEDIIQQSTALSRDNNLRRRIRDDSSFFRNFNIKL